MSGVYTKESRKKMGLDLFEKNLHPGIVADIREWAKNPELSKLLIKLQSLKDWQQFLNHYAEAIVARYLINQECEIKVEVPTINGKSADFEVSKSSETFFVHVKRLNFDEEMQNDFNVGTRLDRLRKEGIGFLFYKSLTDLEMQQFYKEARSFSREAKDGDSKEIKSKSGEVLGECDKIKNGQSTTVYSVKSVDYSDRYSKKLKDAYEQFMPDSKNVILVTSAWRDSASIEELQESLEDFWFDGKNSCSNIIGWFEFDPRGDSVDFKMFFRKNSVRPNHIVELFSGV